jgi:hypothetical protein
VKPLSYDVQPPKPSRTQTRARVGLAIAEHEVRFMREAIERAIVQANENCDCRRKDCARCLDRSDFLRNFIRATLVVDSKERAEVMFTVTFPLEVQP